jgi:hypothetical protein
MTQPIHRDAHTISATNAFPLPKFITRTRRETDISDTINARQFEHWQTDSAQGVYNRPDPNKPIVFYDMAPNNSRTLNKNYSSQPRYDAAISYKDRNQNSFFDKYDTTFDSRNMTREIQASVYEDKNTGFVAESKKMMERNFDNRWLPQDNKIAQVADILRPKMDDFRISYKSQE